MFDLDGNAAPELKAVADEVVESLDDEGLAKYILDLC
jgi:hydroxymethylpyrimidine pyrophosphatase-like HAD family hydrolase